MLARFRIVPIGIGADLAGEISRVLKLVDESGLPYQLNDLDTEVEGDWDQIMSLVKKCHQQAVNDAPRVLTEVSLDERKGRQEHIADHVKKVEQTLGKTLRRSTV